MKHSIFLCSLIALSVSAEELIKVTMTGDSTGSLVTAFSNGYALRQDFHAKGPNRQFNFGSTKIIRTGFGQSCHIKHSGDDATPWNLNSTYIGANHGDFNAFAVICKEPHGLTEKDCGSTWHDANGNAFHIVRIENKNSFLVLSDNKGQGKGPWKFIRPKGTVLKNPDGRVISGFSAQNRQLYPAVRILSRIFKADGKILPEKCQTECKVFTVEEKYDILATDSILAHVLKNKGRQTAFDDPEVERVLTQTIVYTFYPDHSCIVTHNTTFFRDVRLGYMGFIQSSPLVPGKEYDQHLCYIPKTKLIQYEGETWFFADCLDFTRKIKFVIDFKQDTFENPQSMPDRFIQYLRKSKNYPDIGFVCGYSLLEGCTTPEQRLQGTSQALFLYKTHKTYPYAINGAKTQIKAGQKFYCMAYRQYFVPDSCCYMNQQGKNKVFYADFHGPVRNKVLSIPAGEISVVEKSPTVNFIKVENGLSFTSTGKYGYTVLKIGKE